MGKDELEEIFQKKKKISFKGTRLTLKYGAGRVYPDKDLFICLK